MSGQQQEPGPERSEPTPERLEPGARPGLRPTDVLIPAIPESLTVTEPGSGATVMPGSSPSYATLPDRIRPEDMITEQAVRDPGDPTLGGRDPERDWLLRYAG